jgi:hypothetical protein
MIKTYEFHLDDETISRLIEYARKKFPGPHDTYDDLIPALLTEAGF